MDVNIDEKLLRQNMIKLFALGVKYANDIITGTDLSYTNIVSEIFDNGNDPASIDEILERLNKYKNANYGEECYRANGIAYRVNVNESLIKDVTKRLNSYAEIK